MIPETDLFFHYEHHVVPGVSSVHWGGHYEVTHKPSGLVLKSKDLAYYDNKYLARQELRREMEKIVKEKTN